MKAIFRKTLIAGVICLLTTIFFAGASHASAWYYNMNIIKIGSSAAGVVLTVQNAAKTVTLQKFLESTDAKTLLAIALTAQSLTKPVHVYYDTPSNTFTSVVLSDE